jgi:uncharacterized protein (TIGR02444 family)
VPLRQFALAVHEAEGVSAACVSLQDQFGLDVNLLLLAAYVGAARGQTLTADQLDTARAVVDAWNIEVVRPLRGVRRRLKSGPAPAPTPQTDEMRAQVAKAELDGELIELELLGAWVADLEAAPTTLSSDVSAMAAMVLVVRSYSSEPLNEGDRQALATVAGAAARHSEAQS